MSNIKPCSIYILIMLFCFLMTSSSIAKYSVGLLFHHSRNEVFDIDVSRTLFKKSTFFITVNKSLFTKSVFEGFDFGIRKYFNNSREHWYLNFGLYMRELELEDTERIFTGIGFKQQIHKRYYINSVYNLNFVSRSTSLQFDPRFRFYFGYNFSK